MNFEFHNPTHLIFGAIQGPADWFTGTVRIDPLFL
jgi:hypothetical protein